MIRPFPIGRSPRNRVPKLLLVLGLFLITLELTRQFFQPWNLLSLSSFIRSVDPRFVATYTTVDKIKTTIGVSVTVTKCGSEHTVDGAIVLQYSILQQPSKYQFKFYILHHPDALQCVQPLANLGWTVLERDVPINISLIEGDFLRGRIAGSGCCGERELIKFEAFQLTDHPVVILFDLDMMVLKPMDELVDMILYNNLNSSSSSRMNLLQWPNNHSVVDDVWLLHVNDYAWSDHYSKYYPMQGGFAVIKPNRSIYQAIREIVLKGDYDGDGWGGIAGMYWGSTTFQGLMPYYFRVLYPGHALELKWCTHDAANTGSPFEERGNKTVCTFPTCEDCSKVHPSEIYSFHFTACYKPWMCLPHSEPTQVARNCRHMHQTWFDTRSAMEISWGRAGHGNGSEKKEMLEKFHGYCSEYELDGYESIRQPYGVKA